MTASSLLRAGLLDSKLTLHTLQQGAGHVRDVCGYFFQSTSDQCDQEAAKTLCSTIPGTMALPDCFVSLDRR